MTDPIRFFRKERPAKVLNTNTPRKLSLWTFDIQRNLIRSLPSALYYKNIGTIPLYISIPLRLTEEQVLDLEHGDRMSFVKQILKLNGIELIRLFNIRTPIKIEMIRESKLVQIHEYGFDENAVSNSTSFRNWKIKKNKFVDAEESAAAFLKKE